MDNRWYSAAIAIFRNWWKQLWCEHSYMFALSEDGETFYQCLKCGHARHIR